MTPFERFVLEILSGSVAASGWYQIEVRLSMIHSPAERPRLPGVLTRLVENGFVVEVPFPVEPLQRYMITESGRQALEQPNEG